MTKTTQKAHRSVLGGISVTTGTLVALFFLATFALAVNVSADTRDSRDRGSTGRTIEPTPTPSPAPSPAPTPTPPPPQGGITNVTSGGVSSGGNTGGNVVTGNEYVDVHEVNIGPTNPPPPPPPAATPTPPPPPPAPECDPRDRTGCATQDQDGGRTR